MLDDGKQRIVFYGPARGADREAYDRWRAAETPQPALFVPLPYKDHSGSLSEEDCTDLLRRGYAFEEREFGDRGRAFMDTGLVSHNRTMAVIFCDLKRSTQLLRGLHALAFHKVQNALAQMCVAAIAEVNRANPPMVRSASDPRSERETPRYYPRVVLDKMMGDGFLIYVDCGSDAAACDREASASSMALQLMEILVRNLPEQVEGIAGTRLGLRFGAALGNGNTLSVLADNQGPGFTRGDFTLTGETVNLAVRLEHSSPADFLAAIEDSRQRLAPYLTRIEERDRLRGTRLFEDLLITDQQTIYLYEICEKDFEIRVDDRFRQALAVNQEIERFAWRKVPFGPRGFGEGRWAHLLGGNTVSELFRQV